MLETRIHVGLNTTTRHESTNEVRTLLYAVSTRQTTDLSLLLNNIVKMSIVYVGVNSKKSSKYSRHSSLHEQLNGKLENMCRTGVTLTNLEVRWKRLIHRGWEDIFVVQLIVDPLKQTFHVGWGRELEGLNCCVVCPEIPAAKGKNKKKL